MNAKTDTRPLVSRCPGCGQPVDPPDATRCPLCDFDFGDNRVTGADVTPYAKAYAQGSPGWWTMCRWVWFAGSQRLKHIALMRTSAAARRFAWINALWLALGLAIFQGTHVGWNWVLRSGPALKPEGRGWLHIAESPRPLVSGFVGDSLDLWWNPAQAMISAVVAGLSGLLLLWTVRQLIGVGIAFSHQSIYRGEQRMSAALLYSSAWAIPGLIGAWSCLLRPAAFIIQVKPRPPADQTIVMLAGGIVAVATLFWWIWLVRLGGTTPHATRTRVSGFLLVGAPLIAVAVAAGWWVSLEWLNTKLFFRLNMHF